MLSTYIEGLTRASDPHRQQVGRKLRDMTMRCKSLTLQSDEMVVVEHMVLDMTRALNQYSKLSYSDVAPLATWLNVLSLHNKR